MPYLIEVPLEEGGSIAIEADEGSLGPVRASARPGEVVATVGETLESAIDRIRPAAASIAKRLQATEHPPTAVRVEFGVTVSASAGLVIAKGTAAANMLVTLTWERQ